MHPYTRAHILEIKYKRYIIKNIPISNYYLNIERTHEGVVLWMYSGFTIITIIETFLNLH